MKWISKLRKNRFGLVLLLTLILLTISTLIRIGLTISSFHDLEFSLRNVIGIFGIGLFYDLVNASYFILPLALILWMLPEKIYRGRVTRAAIYTLFFVLVFTLLFSAAAEILFWDEFNTRFNFIAVDYLVYTNLVVGNIMESYPIVWIMISISIVAIAVVVMARRPIAMTTQTTLSFRPRTLWFLALILPAMLSFTAVDSKLHHFSQNSYVNELAGNGMYELFSAYRNNELDYEQFYETLDDPQVDEPWKSVSQKASSEPVAPTQRTVLDDRDELHPNVVLISVESLSAEFLESFGNDKHITPFLDSLAKQSLLFTNLYATGTRTVRGMEALSLSVPPTPGQSIVRRPHNEHLFSMATVFNEKGYESKFIFGGYSYFDNMGYFFENNGYKVVDRSAIPDDQIAYENIWGVADENLFSLAIREIDKTVASGKPAFAHVMTTSNHRPYTYPEGRIDIPSHTGRDGAVKYTDYAIREFFRAVATKPWFANTLFIVVADHCASSAGKTELPIDKYHIPMIMYWPGVIQPGVQPRLMSQIDLAPTLFGMLHFSYDSKFFGYDIERLPAGKERVFISTYQLLGYVSRDSLVVLAPRKQVDIFQLDSLQEVHQKVATPALPRIEREAIAWYQVASRAFREGMMREY